jgi:hypothetical protein
MQTGDLQRRKIRDVAINVPQCLFSFDPVRGSENDVNGSFTCGMCGENFLTG